MAASQFNFFTLIFSFVVVILATFGLSEVKADGFTVDMFHRDSPDSPFYKSSESGYERLAAAFRRSLNRAQRFNPAFSAPLGSAEAPVKSDLGEYLVKISLGSPPFPIAAIVDTGSDLTWTQCKPCKDCFKQTAPLFDPKKSKTYRNISCESSICDQIEGSFCTGKSACGYSISYGAQGQSYSNGVIASDTVTLSSAASRPVALPKTTFGCGFNNQGIFKEETSGIVGLGAGPESLVSQMGSSIKGKFSYCLVPVYSEATSKLHFGDKAIVAGSTAVSTPLIAGDPPTFYYLNLQAISVGKKRLIYTDYPFGKSKGNIIIDSGTTLTLLPREFYSEFEAAVAAQIKMKRSENPVPGLDLCYESKKDDVQSPKITVHFQGADVELSDVNIFVRASDDLVCFNFAPADGIAIYGNLAQMNFLVGYDSVKKTVSFEPADCTKAN